MELWPAWQDLSPILDYTFLLILPESWRNSHYLEHIWSWGKKVKATDPGELVLNPIPFKSLDPRESQVTIPEQLDESTKAPIWQWEREWLIPSSIISSNFITFIHSFIYFFFIYVCMCVGAHVGGQRTASRTLPSSSTMRVLKIEYKATYRISRKVLVYWDILWIPPFASILAWGD